MFCLLWLPQLTRMNYLLVAKVKASDEEMLTLEDSESIGGRASLRNEKKPINSQQVIVFVYHQCISSSDEELLIL